jgi:hypothetical protein
MVSCRDGGSDASVSARPAPEQAKLTFVFPPKSVRDFTANGSSGQVFAKGKWHLIASTSGEHGLPTANSVNIYCNKFERKCSEVISLVWTDQDSKAFGSTPLLDVNLEEYQIVEWSPTLIKARGASMGAEGELQISVPNKTATRSWRGRADSTPYSEEYNLE